MESSSGRLEEERRKQEELKKQIAFLQAQLVELPDDAPAAKAPTSPKRKNPEPILLAPATPSPKKKRKLDHPKQGMGSVRPVFAKTARKDASKRAPAEAGSIEKLCIKPAPSKMLDQLATMSSAVDTTPVAAVSRTKGFKETPHLEVDEPSGPIRDERLALIEDLEPGPYDHRPPSDDPNFDKLEPHSGINLSSRKISHEDFQDYLRARYYLSPSRLYSAVRLLPDKQGYDVPVPGDWVTIAVVAERGPIKFTRAPVTVGPDEDEGRKVKGKEKLPEKPSGKRFVNMKLVDFGARARSSSSATGGKAVIRGDAFLSLLLFESDGFDLMSNDDKRQEKIYKGGSRGAFESMAKLKEGDVVALLNPKILKPFQRSADTPHPVNNILAVTPESAASIVVIGRSRDLGMCTVQKRDGKVCGSWCDKSVSEVCEYHVQAAVQHRRAARPEFSVGTSGLTTSTKSTRKHDYDPLRQWGLKPEGVSSGATYIVSGHVVSGSNSDSRTLFVSETMGREGQAKAKRKTAGKDADRALKLLLERDREGMRDVMKAREFSGKGKLGGEKGKGKETGEKDDSVQSKGAYSASVIKSLGFDPSLKPGVRRVDNAETQKKFEELEAVRVARKVIELGRRPGTRIRSGVVVPKSAKDHPAKKPFVNADGLCDLDENDDELPDQILPSQKTVEDEKIIDLDDI